MSFGMIMISSNYFAITREEQYYSQFCHEILDSKTKLAYCSTVISNRHDSELLEELASIISDIDSLTLALLQYSQPENSGIHALSKDVQKEIYHAYNIIDTLLDQTKVEIVGYESINRTVIRHSTYTFLTLGIMVIVILIFRGLSVIRSVTRPIKELVLTANKIIAGDRKAKVSIQSRDEFYILAQSFNNMLESLEQTTVSKDYLNNILENMFDALIVTDKDMIIRSFNHSAIELLEYADSELRGREINTLFKNGTAWSKGQKTGRQTLLQVKNNINRTEQIKSKSGRYIPALLSCAELKDTRGEIRGLIIVCHDLSEQYMIERKLEQTRKESLILINDAQEEERVRIARDLHDGMGQMLTAISYAVHELSPDDASNVISRDDVQNIQQQISVAIMEAKNIAHDLIPIVLKDFGLIAAIENLIRKANELQKTQFTFNAFDFNERIDPKLEKALYRICQETVNNIIKHAQAKKATYQIFRQNRAVVLVIEDDGQGFDTVLNNKEEQKPGIGLISINERVQAFDGTFTINSSPSFGTEIIIEIPCRKIK